MENEDYLLNWSYWVNVSLSVSLFRSRVHKKNLCSRTQHNWALIKSLYYVVCIYEILNYHFESCF